MKMLLFPILTLSLMTGADAAPQSPPKMEAIRLPAPKMEKGIPLMEALKKRKSERSYAEKKLSLQQLSELLWAANGVNRDDGRRTAPAAVNKQAVDLYVVLSEGVYLYDAQANRLNPVKAGDYRTATGSQDFVKTAPMALVFVADLGKLKDLPERARNLDEEMKIRWALVSAGCQSQNVSLYCASEGLGTVVRGSIDAKTFADAVGLRPDQRVLFAQTVGVPK